MGGRGAGWKKCGCCFMSFDVISDSSLRRMPCLISRCFRCPQIVLCCVILIIMLCFWYNSFHCYWLLNWKTRFLWLRCGSISHFLQAAFFLASLFKTIWHINSASQIRSGEPAESTPWRLSVALPLYSIISADDWWHTISKPSLRSCGGHWSMPSIVGRQAGGTPGSSIWSQGFSRTHTACGAAGLAGWTSVCDVQAGWTSRPSTQPASQPNERPVHS